MSERYTEQARMVIALAKQEPRRFKSTYIGTEHYLLAVLQVKKGTAFRMLASLNLDLAELAAAVEKKCEKGLEDVGWGELPSTLRAKRVVQLALEEARTLGSVWVTTGHFLLALLREEEGVASDVLKDFGVRLEQVRELLPQFPEESSDERAAELSNRDRAAMEKMQRALGVPTRTEALEEAAKIVCKQRGWPLDLRTTDELLSEYFTGPPRGEVPGDWFSRLLQQYAYDRDFGRYVKADREWRKELPASPKLEYVLHVLWHGRTTARPALTLREIMKQKDENFEAWADVFDELYTRMRPKES